MRTIDALRRSGVGIGPERTIRETAAIMEYAGVGALAVIDGEQLAGTCDRSRSRASWAGPRSRPRREG